MGVAESQKRPKVVANSLEDDKENLGELNHKSKRRKTADEAFGTNPLPKLEKFTINVGCIFHGEYLSDRYNIIIIVIYNMWV